VRTAYSDLSWHLLRRFLASLINLQDLKLHFGPQNQRLHVNGGGFLSPRYDSDGPHGLLYDLFPRGKTWPNLKTLSLEYAQATTNNLVTLIHDHKETLQVLEGSLVKGNNDSYERNLYDVG